MIWLWFLAGALLLVVWGGGFVASEFGYKINASPQIGATALVFVALGTAYFLMWLRAKAAARALEREIIRQAEQQAKDARPDRRAEILQLTEQMQKSIAALKSSNFAGVRALHKLPWYVIIGPPGVGKTTALHHSGLAFPASPDSNDGRTRGVGGTRNCDWWFTTDGILLDTAGRYAADTSDHEEWMSFLDMLKKFRSSVPINGVILAVSVPEVQAAPEREIDALAKKLRGRIDEIMTRLQMVVPVYLMFTKTDLVAGFSEFWADLRKSDRAQIWGATFVLEKSSKMHPGDAFEREFDSLVRRIHARAISRLQSEQQPTARVHIAQFPVEFRSLRGNLAELVSTLFQRNAYQETPIFRGFYFTSGTQEGKPGARAIAGIANAFGLGQVTGSLGEPKEPKSYFVTDLFRRVVFPDKNVAARTAAQARRQTVVRLATSTCALVAALVLVIPSSCTFLHNLALVHDAERLASIARSINWTDGNAISDKITKLDAVRDQLKHIDSWNADGAPVGMRWGMYEGRSIYAPLRDAYADAVERGFEPPVRTEIEAHLRNADVGGPRPGDSSLRLYRELKAYLMLTDRSHLEPTWAAPLLATAWSKALRTTKPTDPGMLSPHVLYYLEFMKRGEANTWPVDSVAIDRSRTELRNVPLLQRTYERIAQTVNTDLPPVQRETVFYGIFGPFVTSKTDAKVDGVYTKKGWEKVRSLIASETERAEKETWVLKEDPSHRSSMLAQVMASLRGQYFERYLAAWREFLGDLQVARPPSQTGAWDELNALVEPEWAYLRLVHLIEANAILEVTADEAGQVLPPVADQALQVGSTQLAKRLQGADSGAALTPQSLVPKTPQSIVELSFTPFMRFAAVPTGAAPDTPTPLMQYVASVSKLIAVMTDMRDSKLPPSQHTLADQYSETQKTAMTLMSGMDPRTRALWQPLLMNPINPLATH